MKQFIKQNFAILLAFILPLVFIVGVALSVYLPLASLSTNYNFVYSSCFGGTDYYSYQCDRYLQNRYSVVNGKIVLNTIGPKQDSDKNGVFDVNETYTARLFLHDTQKNESKEITLKEAQTLTLDNLLTSSDGVTILSHYNQGGDFFIFGRGSSSYGYYLTKGKARVKLELINNSDQYYYQNNFQFLGWVLPGRN